LADVETLAVGEVVLEGLDFVEIVEVVRSVIVEKGAGGVEREKVVTDEVGSDALGLGEGEVAGDEGKEKEREGEGGQPEAAEGGGGRFVRFRRHISSDVFIIGTSMQQLACNTN
jgi:hypothetical protein